MSFLDKMFKSSKKRDNALAKRMEQLGERGIDVVNRTATMSEIAAVVGDLTLGEFQDMLQNEQTRLVVASTRPYPNCMAQPEADRQRTYARQAELRAKKGADSEAQRPGPHG